MTAPPLYTPQSAGEPAFDSGKPSFASVLLRRPSAKLAATKPAATKPRATKRVARPKPLTHPATMGDVVDVQQLSSQQQLHRSLSKSSLAVVPTSTSISAASRYQTTAACATAPVHSSRRLQAQPSPLGDALSALETYKAELADMPTQALIDGVASLLETLVDTSTTVKTVFDETNPHRLVAPVRSMVQSMVDTKLCSRECLVLALIYCHRLIQQHANFAVTPRNVNRVVVCAMLLGSKLIDDRYCRNTYYASCLNVDLHTLNKLELNFWFCISFRLGVSVDEFASVASPIRQHALAAAPIPPPLFAQPMTPYIACPSSPFVVSMPSPMCYSAVSTAPTFPSPRALVAPQVISRNSSITSILDTSSSSMDFMPQTFFAPTPAPQAVWVDAAAHDLCKQQPFPAYQQPHHHHQFEQQQPPFFPQLHVQQQQIPLMPQQYSHLASATPAFHVPQLQPNAHSEEQQPFQTQHTMFQQHQHQPYQQPQHHQLYQATHQATHFQAPVMQSIPPLPCGFASGPHTVAATEFGQPYDTVPHSHYLL
eukprot:m.160434 g.160434  ORF g.160434 m.160434 type:complete len:539 (-) comp14351_c0_seq1:306-1922(-)